ncbi:ribonuclease M5 [Paracholeplasma manati]|uniref:ribonuclease M5 n=1 Tax=Paracholeplasma manati TaxID=591373 RepID=UPI0024087EBB|nr:ribonuclease M5 [Paracholeplasma manati]MDG0889333.1 ribonuclease M5 [Paracholeplasma manati]
MPEIIVVEGRHDYQKIKAVLPEVDILVTNGSAIEESFLQQLERLSTTHDIIVFVDADNAGERLRRIITKRIPSVKHAFIERNLSLSHNEKKVGIEHADHDTILTALQLKRSAKPGSDITKHFLLELKLIGENESRKKRLFLCEVLNIGYTNGKGLYQRLALFGITQQEVKEVLDGYQSS